GNADRRNVQREKQGCVEWKAEYGSADREGLGPVEKDICNSEGKACLRGGRDEVLCVGNSGCVVCFSAGCGEGGCGERRKSAGAVWSGEIAYGAGGRQRARGYECGGRFMVGRGVEAV